MKPCQKTDGMNSPLFVPDKSISTSTRPEAKINVRPDSKKPWTSSKDDKKPEIRVQFPQRTPIAGVDLPKLTNVDSVTVVTKPGDSPKVSI